MQTSPAQPLRVRLPLPWAAAALACALLSTAAPARAQVAPGDTGGAGTFGGRGGRRHRGGQRRQQPQQAAAQDLPKLVRDPAQRLDPGALLCRTEQALAQHQAAVSARLDGGSAPEPAGCRLVATLTPVAVLDRHGPARTEVRLPGPPEQVGWTDARVPDAPAPAR